MKQVLPKFLRFACLSGLLLGALHTVQGQSRQIRLGDNMGDQIASKDLEMSNKQILNTSGIAIGSASIYNSSVALQIDGTDKAILIPRITSLTAIASPENGMMVYNTADSKFYVRQGNVWASFADGSGSVISMNGKVGAVTFEGDETTITVNNTGATILISAKNATAIWNANKLNGNSVSAQNPVSGQVLGWNGTEWKPVDMPNSTAAAGTLTGTALNPSVVSSSLTSVGTLSDLTVTNPIVGSVTGNAATATKLTASRTINGQPFDGTANVTISASNVPSTPSGSVTAVNVQDAISELDGKLATKASLASPTFTGTVTLPVDASGVTAAPLSNNNKLATTAYVDAAAALGTADATTLLKGKVQLAGDLTGTAALPTIAAAAVTTSKIADANVTSDKLAPASVTTSKLADGSVTLAKQGDLPTGSIVGRTTAGNGAPEALNAVSAKALLGLNNLDNTSDANKPVSIAGQAALDLKANATELAAKANQTMVDAALALKANATDLAAKANQSALDAAVTSIAGKANQTDLTGAVTSISGKADQTAVDAALLTKANATDLAAKANQTALDAAVTSIAGKANQTDLTAAVTSIAGKADQSAVDAALLTKANATDLAAKANQTALDAAITSISGKANQTDLTAAVSSIAGKADQTAVDAALSNKANATDLAAKANQTALDAAVTSIAGKANQTDLTAAVSSIAGKADQTAVDAALANKANATDLAAKANQTALDAAVTSIAGKANQTDLTAAVSSIAGKADQTAVDAALANKANATDLATKANQTALDAAVTSISGKADQTAVNTALGLKADASALTTGLAAVNTAIDSKASQTALDAAVTSISGKADQTAINTALGLKADASALTSGLATVTTAIEGKASQTALDAAVTSISGKADQTAVNTALGLKADASALTSGLATVTTALEGKASQTALDAAVTSISGKADQTAVNTALGLKADAATVNTALGLKADASALTSGLATVTTAIESKASQTALDAAVTSISGKADQTAVNTALGLKADASALTSGLATVTTAIEGKASQTALDAAITTIGTKASQAAVDLKADQTAVDAALALKATQTTVDAALATKATQTALDAAITTIGTKASQASVDLKADQTAVDAALALKATQTTVDAALATKATQTALDAVITTIGTKASQASVDLKADQTAVDAALALKATQTTVDAALATKATQTALDAAITTIGTKASQTALDAAITTIGTKASQASVDLKADQTALDAAITTIGTKASQAAVDLKADQTAVDAALALKATQTTVDAALATKATQTALDAAITTIGTKASQASVDLKADQTAVDAALALKATQTTVDAALATKATQTALDAVITTIGTKASQASVDLKADQTAVDAALALKATQTTVDAALATKATQTALDAAITTIGTKASQTALDAAITTIGTKASQASVDLKADQTALDAAITTIGTKASQASVDLKADQTAVDAALALKATQTTVDAALATKATQTALDAAITTIGTKASQASVDLKADQTALDGAIITIGTKASQTALDAAITTIGTKASQAAVDLKADQTALDAAITTIGTKASQTALDAAITTIGTKASQASVDLKADQTALDAAITTIGTKASQAAVDLKAPLASPTFTGTVSGITKGMVGLADVDNTSDAAKPVSTATQAALDLKGSAADLALKAPLASPTFTGTVSGITKGMVGLADVDNTSDAAKPVSTATQAALDLKGSAADLALKAPLASPTFTGTVSGITKGMVGLADVDNTSDAAKPVSTATQAALDLKGSAAELALKAPLASPAFTGTVTGITSAMVGLGNVNNTADADKPVSAATQTALDAKATTTALTAVSDAVPLKAPLASPTFTGTVSGITKGMVGLADVDNTSDAAKPVSTATQAALDLKGSAADLALKAPLASPAFTGTVTGITSAMVGLGNVNNTADADKPVSAATQTALDAKATTTALTAVSDAVALKAPLASPTFTGTVSGITKGMVGLPDVDNTSDAAKPISTLTQAALDLKGSAADLALKAPLASPAFTGTVTGITSAMVGLGNVNNTADADKPVSAATQTALDAKATTTALTAVSDAVALKAPLASPTFTGTVSGITKGMVGLADVDNTSDAAKPVSTATQAALDLKGSAADLALKAPLASPTFTGTVSGITKGMVGLADVDNTSDAAKPVSTATQAALDLKGSAADLALKAPLASPTFTGTVSGITKGMVGLADVDNTSDAAKPVSTATQAALDLKGSAAELALKAPLASPAFTGTVTGITSAMVGLGNVNNTADADKPVSAATQTALDAKATTTALTAVSDAVALKAPLASPTFTGTVSGITKGMVGLPDVDNTSDAAKPISTLTQAALDLKGSAADLALKAPLASPAFTGTVTGITSAMVGLGNVNNTADADKPVSAATQTALDAKATTTALTAVSDAVALKAPLASPTFTGTVSGITKGMVGLADVDNTSDAAKPVSTATQAALDLKGSAAELALKAPLASPAFTGTVTGITSAMVGLGNVNNTADADKPVSAATQTALDAKATTTALTAVSDAVALKAPLASPTFTGTVSGITKGMVGLPDVDNTSDAAKPISTLTQAALDLKGSAADLALKAPLASPAFTGTVTGITSAMVGLGNVNNTADADKPVSAATQTALDAKATTTALTAVSDAVALKAPLASPTFTGTVSGITKGMVGLADVDNTSDAAKPVSTATQAALDLKGSAADLALKAPLASPAFTGTVTGITSAMVGLGNVNNTADADKPVSASTQTALDAKATTTALTAVSDAVALKAPLASPTFTGTVSGITKGMVGLADVDNTSDAAKPVSTATQAALDLKGSAADLALKAPLASPTFTGTVSGITKGMVGLADVDNTSDAAKPVSTATQAALDLKGSAAELALKAPLASPTFTGTVSGITKGMVGLADVDNTSDAAKPVSTATQAALDLKGSAADLALKAPLASPAFTGTVTGITSAMVGLGNVNNTADADKPVSGATQTALDAKATTTALTAVSDAVALKAPLASPTFTGTVSGITKGMVGLADVDNTSDAAKPVSTATQAALDLKGSAADLALKAPLASPTFTGTVSGITKGMVGLADVDNTSDAAKPVSTATQAALDLKGSAADLALKAPLASPTFTGTVSGITKGMVGLADVDNTSDAAKPVSTATQAALDLKGSAAELALKAPLASPTFTGTVSGITKGMVGLADVDNTSDAAKPVSTATQAALDLKATTAALALKADQSAVDLKAPLASPTFTGTVSGITKGMVGLADVDNTSDAAKPVSTATQAALDLKGSAADLALKAPLASPTFTGTVSGITKGMVGLADVDNTSDAAKPVSTATQAALDLKGSAAELALKAPLASPTFTGTVSGITKGMVGLADVDNTSDAAKPVSTATQAALDLKATTAALALKADQSAVDLKAPLASPTFTGTVSGITKGMVGLADVDNTSDAAKPVSTATQAALDLKGSAADLALKAPLASPTFTGTVSGITKGMVGLADVDNTSDAAKPVSTATQAALDLKGSAAELALKAPLASPTFTGTVSGITKGMVGLADVDNTSDAAKPVSTATQAALDLKATTAALALKADQSAVDLKAPLASPTFTGTVSGITKGMVGLADVDNTSDAAKPVSTATQAALDLKGSAADLALKAPLASPTFTGTVSGITKGMVGLADVDNTSDAAKPVSTATQAALDLKGSAAELALKAPLASPTFTGTVSGITKGMVGLADVDNTSDAAKPVSTATQAALDLKGSAADLALKAPLASPAFTGTVTGITSAMVGLGNVNNTADADKPVSGATQTALDAKATTTALTAVSDAVALKAPLASPAFTGTVTGINSAMVGLGNVNNTADADKPVSGATQTALDAKATTTALTAVSDAVALKAPLASPTFTGTVSGITKGMVGLPDVDNTSDAAKPISTLTQAALDLKGSAADLALKAPLASPAFTGTVTGITSAMVGLGNVNNTADADKPVSGATQTALDAKATTTALTAVSDAVALKAPLASPTFTGTVSGITKGMVGLADVDNTSDAAKPVSTATQAALDLKGSAADLALKAPLASPAFTGTVTGITSAMVGLGNVNNTADADKPVSGATQTALDAKATTTALTAVSDAVALKAPLASPAFTGTVTGITSAMVGLGNVNNTADADKPVSGATQTALDAKATTTALTAVSDAVALKAPLASPTFTGTVSGITKGMVGLADVDNTSDAAKPVSTATQAALDLKGSAADLALKAPLASPAFTGTVTGITSAMVGLGNVDNTSDANKPVSTATQTALDAKATTTALTAVSDAVALKAPLASPTFTGTVSGITKGMVGLGNVDNTTDLLKPISTATQAALDLKGSAADLALKAPLASPTFTGTVSGITSAMVGLGNVDNTSDANKPVSSATQTALDAKATTAALALKADQTDVDLKANIASPTFTGTVTAPTFVGALTGNATTATSAGTVTTNANLTGVVTSVGNATSIANSAITNAMLANTAVATLSGTNTGDQDLSALAPKADPTFTGTVTAPTFVGALTGNASSATTAGTVTTNANLTGEVTSSGNATTVTNAAVIGKVLTGLNTTAGTPVAADDIVGAIGKLTGSVALKANSADPTFTGTVTAPTFVGALTGNASSATTVTTNANLTGEVTSTGNATTVTNAAVIGKVLTGLNTEAGTPAAADNIVGAIGKLTGSVALKANSADPIFTGTVSAPTFVGALTGNAATATTSTNLAAGELGTIPYQSAAGTTAMLAVGSVGQVLQSNGSAAPTWVNPAIGDVTLAGPQTVTGAKTFTGGIITTGTSTLSFGEDVSAQTINLGTGGAAKLVTIGSTNGASSLTERVGTGNYNLDGVAGSNYNIGASTTTGTITIGGTAQTGTMTIGSSSGTNILAIGSGAGATTLNIGNGIAGNVVSIGNGNNSAAQTVDIASGASAGNSTVNILSGTGSAGAGVLLMGNNPRVTTIDIGDVNPAAARTTNIATNSSGIVNTINIGTGATTVAGGNTINIGNGTPTGTGTNVISIGSSFGNSVTTIKSNLVRSIGPVITGAITAVLSGANMAKGKVFQLTGGNARTFTLDNGTNLSAAIPGVQVGDMISFLVVNSSTNTLTLAGGTGTTLAGSPITMTTNTSRMCYAINTGATTWSVF